MPETNLATSLPIENVSRVYWMLFVVFIIVALLSSFLAIAIVYSLPATVRSLSC